MQLDRVRLRIAPIVLACGAGCASNSADPLQWRDDFDGVDPDPWRVLHPELADASVTNGELRLRPDAFTAWYASSEAYHQYLLVDGDFAVTSRLRVGDLDGEPAAPDWRVGGLLVRDPGPGTIDAYHAAFGTVSAALESGMVAEFKSTVAGVSTLGFQSHASGSGELRICRVGNSVRAVYRAEGATAWTLLDQRLRPELPMQVAVGPMAYAYAPVGDLEAAFDYVDIAPLDSILECEAELPVGPASDAGDSEGMVGTSEGGESSSGGSGEEDSGAATPGAGAVLPDHPRLDILVISDSVNPNGLSDAQLTQAGDLAIALASPDSPLEIASIDEVASNCINPAMHALASGDVDVIVYFAHQPARRCNGNAAQTQLTTAVQQHLQTRGGVVVFHHGIYEVSGKQAILQLLGGRATQLQWNASQGQTVVNVAPGHFVTTQGMDYPDSTTLSDASLGIVLDEYASFTNIPDERYPDLQLLTQPGETRELLFAASYDGVQPLGYDLHRPGWTGHVVLYQPGEYQPLALDPEGPNFQVLVNAIYYAATELENG